jgi:hypothetical protein
LTPAGALTREGRTLADPLIVSYEDTASGKKPIAAGRVVLFPASPSGRFRVVQACDKAGPDALCWTVRLFDRETGRFHNISAGKYGPTRWQSWSSDERHLVLADSNEGAWRLHVIDAADGTSRTFPSEASNENWTVRRETLAWTGPRSFRVVVKTCERCPARGKRVHF